MSNSVLQKGLELIYKKFSRNTATMLVVTGTIGWALSSAAQMLAVIINPNITKEQKGFLLPQEAFDALVNISSFLLITQCTKKFISKMASTGKIASNGVREYLNKRKDIYGSKIGKLDLDLDKVLAKDHNFPTNEYYSYKNFVTTVGTVGASIFASNIVTPVLRNSMASNVQKKYLNNRPQNYSSGMKV